MLTKMLTGILGGIVVVVVICLFIILIMSPRNKDRSIDDRAQEEFLAEWGKKKR